MPNLHFKLCGFAALREKYTSNFNKAQPRDQSLKIHVLPALHIRPFHHFGHRLCDHWNVDCISETI
jgi:hypothetical protein